ALCSGARKILATEKTAASRRTPQKSALGFPVITVAGAGTAEGAAFADDFALEVYAFAALGADYPGAFEAGQIFRRDLDLYPFLIEENFVGELRVGFLLAGFFVHFREHFAGGLLGGFLGGDADGPASFEVNK